jgi:hypothetical protein
MILLLLLLLLKRRKIKTFGMSELVARRPS